MEENALQSLQGIQGGVPKGGENGPRVGWGIWGHSAQPLHLPVGAMEINICAWVLRGAMLVHQGCYGD